MVGLVTPIAVGEVRRYLTHQLSAEHFKRDIPLTEKQKRKPSFDAAVRTAVSVDGWWR
jgi:hypothetical protein